MPSRYAIEYADVWPKYAFYEPVHVIDNIYLSGVAFTDDFLDYCRKHDLTYILNAAGGYARKDFYKGEIDMDYLQLDMIDQHEQKLRPFMKDAYEFIEEGRMKQQKVLVHCIWGVSRSSSCLIYYIMKKYHKTFDEALVIIHKVRPTSIPNYAFEDELREMDLELRSERQMSMTKYTLPKDKTIKFIPVPDMGKCQSKQIARPLTPTTISPPKLQTRRALAPSKPKKRMSRFEKAMITLQKSRV